MRFLVIDIGTSGVRTAIVEPGTGVTLSHRTSLPPDTPAPGLVEFDPTVLADVSIELATRTLDEGGPVDAVGIANQRASTIVWDRASGEPVGPGIGWQDLRTIGECLMLQGDGFRIAPNLSVTKAAHLLDLADPDRERDLCVGTVDSWLVNRLTGGRVHVTDATNMGITGFRDASQDDWQHDLLERLRIPVDALPRVVDSVGSIAEASVLPGAPVIAGVVGDQQASLLGQGCVRAGQAKITFGTGAMLDVCLDDRPAHATQGPAGTFPIVALGVDGGRRWGLEAIMLAAGTNIEWLRDDLGIIDDPSETHDIAASITDTGGVAFVPALLGLGTPQWDYGARGALLGLTRGSGRPEIIRAVLEGIAHRAADLVDAAEADAGTSIGALRIDGGMSRNPTFVRLLADATGRTVEVSTEPEATTLGAAWAAALATGGWSGLDDVADAWSPGSSIDPGEPLDRERWRDSVRRAGGWFPDLSAITF